MVRDNQFNRKVLQIKNFYAKHEIVNRECPYTLGIRMHQGKPLITLIKVNVISLVNNRILEIKIPSIVEAIDTQEWLDYKNTDYVRDYIDKIILIGNGKPIYGNLIGAFSFLLDTAMCSYNMKNGFDTEIPLDRPQSIGAEDYSFLQDIQSVEIKNFDGANIHDIQYICIQLQHMCNIDIAQLRLKKIHKAEQVQIEGDLLGELIKQGVQFDKMQSLRGFGRQVSDWRVSKIIDFNNIPIQKISSLDGAFCNCYSLIRIDWLENRLDSRIQCNGTFENCEKLDTIPEELYKVKIISQKGMFENSGIYQIPKLDLRETKDISYMYSLCYNLKAVEIDGHGEQFNIEKAEDLFSGSQNIETIHIKNIKLPSLISLQHAFQSLHKLKSVIFENIEITSNNPVELHELLQYNKSLEKVQFRNIHIKSPVSLNRIFISQVRLVEIGFDNVVLDEVQQMDELFKDCLQLRVLDTDGLDIKKYSQESIFDREHNDGLMEQMFVGSNPHLFIDKAAYLLKLNYQIYTQFLYLMTYLDAKVPDIVLLRAADVITKAGIDFKLLKLVNCADSNLDIIQIGIKLPAHGPLYSAVENLEVRTHYQKEAILKLLGILKNKKDKQN